ncbi:hypothetical protein Malapachy_3417 [Malassezia pachydermatis]|uniref:ER membrane protein complex subunit 1 n=1 Tax=Malassezia pachydermatis TaxID=77020 RepID=A0A0M8MYF6_9BASI|nr:hypothetical protein Malapachy_3417 [Malassezia pachydermatis]KOS16230.1 hypothetical protein Malapachy_3417 [Malassezia pachydermatis]
MLARWVSWLLCFAVLASLVPNQSSAHAFLHLLTPKKPAPPVSSHLSPYFGVPVTEPRKSVRAVHPRFQRFIRDSQDVNTQTSTAFITMTDAGTIGALNPRDGSMVWRRVLDKGDEVISMIPHEETLLLGSTKDNLTLRLVMGKTGIMDWSISFDVQPLLDQVPIHAAFLESGGVDVVAAVGGSLFRIRYGELLWTWTPEQEQRILYVVPYDNHLYVVGATRVGTKWQPRVTVLARTAEQLAVYDVRDDLRDLSSVILLPYARRRHIPDVLHATPSGGPHIAWLARDGSVHAMRLNEPTPKVKVLKAGKSQFAQLYDVGLGDRGLFVGQRADSTAEVLQVGVEGTLRSVWEFEEVAPDAVYDGVLDRQGHAYVLRMYFTRGQHLMNQHVFWADAVNGGHRGQVTGMSYQYDHDRHGNVLAAAVEAAPQGPQRLAVRVGLVTSSGSVQLVHDAEQKWVLEEGLSQPVQTLLVSLPDAGLGPAAVALAPSTAWMAPYAALERESWAGRVVRHVRLLASVPQWLTAYVRASAHRDLASLGSAMQTLLGGASPSAQDKMGPVAGGPRTDSATLLEAPRAASNATLHHDRFGFDMLVLAASRQGKVYGVNQTLHGSAIVWERSLVGFGEAEGAPEPHVNVTHLVQTRATGSLDDNGKPLPPLALVVAEVTMPGQPLETRVWDLDPLTGELLGSQDGATVCDGAIRDVYQAADHVSFVCANGQILRPVSSEPMYIMTLEGGQALQGYLLEQDTLPTWRMPLSPTERVVAMHDPSRDHVASLGTVRGDRSVLYKYLNPHARVIVTYDEQAKLAHVYVIDVVSGEMVYQLQVPGLASGQLHSTYAENWITLQYQADEVLGSERLLSMELYEREGQNDARYISSLARGNNEGELRTRQSPTAFVQTFVLPYSVRAMATTRTTLGVARRSLVIANNRSEVLLLPRRFLDPRRPVGKPTKEDQEEGLLPYQPVLPDEPAWKLIKTNHLAAHLDRIVTAPALLESSSMVLATGLDWVYTVASPSGPFDRLHTSFNKTQLVLTILGLMAGIAITRPLIRMRALNARW